LCLTVVSPNSTPERWRCNDDSPGVEFGDTRTLQPGWPAASAPDTKSLIFLVPVLLANERVQQAGDLLEASGGAVQPAAHLSKPAINLGEAAFDSFTQVVQVFTEVGQVFAHRVEAGRGGLPEVANLASNLLYVAVSAASQHAGGCRVLLAVLDPFGQLADPCLQRGQTSLAIGWVSHGRQPSGPIGGHVGVPPGASATAASAALASTTN
jgi:hypothetical protein